MSDYDSRRTGNGLLDTGSTPVWSISEKSKKTADIPFIQGDSAVFMCWFYILKLLFKNNMVYGLFHNSLDIVPVWR